MKRIILLLMMLSSYTGADDKQHPITKVVVYKEKRLMQLLSEDKIVKQYSISLGDNPIGHKVQEGDERTPEGDYFIDYRNTQSRYRLSLHISYPNEQDKANAKKLGVSPGGDIMIHGSPNKFSWSESILQSMDWTDGCIAVTNDEIDEVGRLVKNGTPIRINP